MSGVKTKPIDDVKTAAEKAAGAKGGKSGVNGLLGALGGVVGVTAAGGPLGIALGGAVLGLGYLETAHENAAAAAQRQKDELDKLNQTLDKTTGKATDETITQTAQELQNGGYFTRAKSFGIDPHTFTLATAGVADADKDKINQQLTGTIVQSLRRDQAYQAITSRGYAAAGLSDTDIAQALQGVPEAVRKFTDARSKYNQGKDRDQQLPDLAHLKNELDDVGESASTLGGQLNGVNSSLADGGKNTRGLTRPSTDLSR
ncbi:hypothetical protein [Nocardia vaccinii]|uniref:hypothetical protein n=1 Tax=Nocardia vaccinii TaxID=1822 RepID=UPI0008298E16|nr:hypothetical protein [Nocardia vaccinii]